MGEGLGTEGIKSCVGAEGRKKSISRNEKTSALRILNIFFFICLMICYN